MGILLLVVGLAVLGFGFMQHLKGKRILAAPFKKTGEIARNPVSSDPKGLMSTEGSVVPPTTAVLSPLSKTACLYYEVAITRRWEKTEQTQDGAKTTKGTTTIETLKGGAQFGLDDGTGAVMVDASKGGDFDNLKKQGEAGGVNMSDGYIQFAELRIPKPVSSGEGYTLGYEAVEKIVPVGGSLFALGKLENGKLSKPGWRSMMFSTKGRDGLLASTAKKKKFSFIGGGIGAVAAIPLMIFGPKVESKPSHNCSHTIADVQASCDDNVSSQSGNSYTWTVTKAGPYALQVTPPAGKKFPLDAQIVLKNAAGEVVADEVATGAGHAVVARAAELPAGVYTVTVRDVDGTTVKGGFDYALEIRSEATGAAVANAPAAAKGGYSAEDLANRVTELNDLCGDTWCEGAFNYNFTKLSCDEGRGCALAFTATNANDKKAYDSVVVVSGFEELRPAPGADYKYEGSFDEAVGNALSAWEAHPTNTKAALKIGAAPVAPPAKNVAAAGKTKPAAKPASKKGAQP
jgi:hypothetical protein